MSNKIVKSFPRLWAHIPLSCHICGYIINKEVYVMFYRSPVHVKCFNKAK